MGYVEDAEKVFKDWYSTRDKKITTSKIRGLLSGMSDIYNECCQSGRRGVASRYC